jgi:hypothetical protein
MASQNPFPLMPPKSTELRLEHFDDKVYRTDQETLLFKFVDAMCGDAGAGTLKKQIFLQRLSGALDGIYGSDLDYIFGGIRFLSRAESESYSHKTMSSMLVSDQWDEVETKDAQYRSRIREFFIACGQGDTVEGIRQVVNAATSADCQVIESWRYIDNFGITQSVGRADGLSYAAVDLSTGHRVLFDTQSAATSFITGKTDWQVQENKARSEVTVVPYKYSLTERENRLLLQMLNRMRNVDTVITISPNGLSVHAPVGVRAASADSTYYQVEKVVTGSPVLDQMPPPEMLAIDLDPTESWLKANSPELAPYGKFNITQEFGYFYLISGGKRSPIDQVSYGTLQKDGSVAAESVFEWYEQTEQYGPWTAYDKADSPDNYPGGRNGLTPTTAPALNPDQSGYRFAYTSQAQYVAQKQAEVVNLGGQANDVRYRLPVQKTTSSKRSYTPDLAIAYTAPVRESTVTSSWTAHKPRAFLAELFDPSPFVRG